MSDNPVNGTMLYHEQMMNLGFLRRGEGDPGTLQLFQKMEIENLGCGGIPTPPLNPSLIFVSEIFTYLEAMKLDWRKGVLPNIGATSHYQQLLPNIASHLANVLGCIMHC